MTAHKTDGTEKSINFVSNTTYSLGITTKITTTRNKILNSCLRMKIPAIMASWGLFLALMSEQVAAQACSSQLDCPTDRYCNPNSNTCMVMGGCVAASDCNIEENFPYRMPFCLGTTICNEGTCDIECGIIPEDEQDKQPLIKCRSGADCPSTLDGQVNVCNRDGYCEIVDDRQITSCTSHEDCRDGYCASDGSCHKIGGCSAVNDCFLPENQGYPIALCMGERTCTNNMCGVNCTSSDALWSCEASEDCPGDDEYCNAFNFCSASGTCASDADCFNRENSFFEIDCVGTKTCENGSCAKVCDGSEPIPSKPLPVPSGETKISCTKDDDCNGSTTTATTRAGSADEMYCAQGTCKPQGSCSTDSDCINPSNVFFSDKRCNGYLFCDETGQCDRECSTNCSNGSPKARCFTNPCDTEDWRSQGAVSCVLDACDNTCDTMLFDAAGSVVTEGGTVTIDRDGTDTFNRDGTDLMTSGTDKGSANTCLSSADCTEPDSYCNTSGFCASNGSCTTNEDCLSTDNTFIEIDCIGLKFCSDEGMCSKNCLSTVGNPCETSGDCLDGEFCAGNGLCLASGTCETVEDCVNAENGLFFPSCVGTVYCQENFCGKKCGGSAETTMDGFVPTSVDGSALMSSASRATPVLATIVVLLAAIMM